MTDPRVNKLAKVLIQYSLNLKPGDQFVIRTSPAAEELNLAVYEEAIKAGAFVVIMQAIPGTREAFYKHASPAQLEHVNAFEKLTTETFDAVPCHRCQPQYPGFDRYRSQAVCAGFKSQSSNGENIYEPGCIR